MAKPDRWWHGAESQALEQTAEKARIIEHILEKSRALLHNTSHKFICKNIYLTAETKNTLITNQYTNSAIKIPIAHGEGNYFANEKTLNSLIKNDQILFKYCDKNGHINVESNPNGSLLNIAGVCNIERNVFGMMPHPERAADLELNNQDGKLLFESILHAVLS